MNLAEFNTVPLERAEALLLDCCGSARWAKLIATGRPYRSVNGLRLAADSAWQQMDRADILEAFSRHPQIGERAAAGTESHRSWSAGEQSGASSAAQDVKARLARLNRTYFEKFGHIYIVCATGKSAEEMLAILEQRLQNGAAQELPIAAEQQRQIMHLRLKKLLADEQRT